MPPSVGTHRCGADRIGPRLHSIDPARGPDRDAQFVAGAGDGPTDGAGEGPIDGACDGPTDGATDGPMDGDGDVPGDGLAAGPIDGATAVVLSR